MAVRPGMTSLTTSKAELIAARLSRLGVLHIRVVHSKSSGFGLRDCCLRSQFPGNSPSVIMARLMAVYLTLNVLEWFMQFTRMVQHGVASVRLMHELNGHDPVLVEQQLFLIQVQKFQAQIPLLQKFWRELPL